MSKTTTDQKDSIKFRKVKISVLHGKNGRFLHSERTLWFVSFIDADEKLNSTIKSFSSHL